MNKQERNARRELIWPGGWHTDKGVSHAGCGHPPRTAADWPRHSTHLEGSIYVTIEFKLGGIVGKNGMRRRPTQNIHDFINYLHI